MAVRKSDKHKEYSRYAAHCLTMMAAANNEETPAIQREMATEWLNLAEAALHPLRANAMMNIAYETARSTG